MDDKKQRTQVQFGATAANYVSSGTFSKGEDLRRLLEIIQPQPDWRVLDIATGGGHTAGLFAPHTQQVIATDLTGPMLMAARTHLQNSLGENGGKVDYARTDAEHLPFLNDTFDLVTCRLAAHHFPNVAGFMAECARVVRPGGLVAIVDMLSPSDEKVAKYINALDVLRDPSHVWAYSLNEWKRFFQGAGLKLEHAEVGDNPQNLADWARRMGCDGPTTMRLRVMLTQAPDAVQTWWKIRLPVAGSGEEIQFFIQQAVMVARK
ncbi:MAG: methyltransferase domain-containing protein [Chloroflexi bacterium]|nr:methyltransferase domain-containing protein [Chloroflexota bacterium]